MAETIAGAGGYPKDLNYKKVFTLQFVNKKAGIRT